MRGENRNFNETLGFLASRGASGHLLRRRESMVRAFINALIIRKRAFLPTRTALNGSSVKTLPMASGRKKMLVLFLCFFVFFCVPHLKAHPSSSALGQPGAPAPARLWRYSCRRDSNRSRGERKTHRGKNDGFSWNSAARPKSLAAPFSSWFALPSKPVGLYYGK
jgi:hypothetical protein